MTNKNLASWLDRSDDELSTSLAEEIRIQVRNLMSDGGIYGYAIMPGLPYEIRTIASAYNRESDLEPDKKGDDYYRFGVNEWKNYLHDGFGRTTALIEDRNKTFGSLHIKDDPDGCSMDECEIKHLQILQKAILQGMMSVRDDGLIGGAAGYAICWLNDTDHPVMKISARELNSQGIHERYLSQFG